MRKYFGTDGVRGVANRELTARLAFNLGRSGAHVLKQYTQHDSDKLKVVVGTDTRISKDMLKSALSAGLMSAGADVVDVDILPTPAIAYLTRHLKADIGVVISASHNPMEYNGIKFFDSKGLKLADEIELEIEKYIENTDMLDDFPTHERIGSMIHVGEPIKLYVDFLKGCVEENLEGIKVVLDTANGAAYQVAPAVFEALGAEVVCISSDPDGTNINKECGSTNTRKLQTRVIEEGADLGLAFDGDADRLIAIDERGEVVDGDRIMLICALDLMKKNMLQKNTLVVTVMSNLGLHMAAKEQGINIVSTAVGDRYVLEEMLDKDYSLGGEQSGHMIFLDYNTTGDGVLSGLKLAEILKGEQTSLSELSSIMEVYPQVLVNANVKNENKNSYHTDEEISALIQSMETTMAEQGRVLIRPSGTEPLVRVMIEGKDFQEINAMAKELAALIESRLG